MITDWKTSLLGSVATLQRGYDLPHRVRKPGSIPIVTSSGFESHHSEAKVKAPGVVTGRYGTIGEVFYVRDDFWPLNTTLYVRNFHDNDPLFVSYLLRTIDFHTHSGKSGVPGVNRNDLHEIEVSLPSTRAEQEAIAEALSDADALIESLEQLIAKKRQIKQGTMQALLSGKKRLPGFRGVWGDVEVRQLVQTPVTDGPHMTPQFLPEGIPFLSVNNLVDNKIDFSDLRYISAADHVEFSRKCKPRRNDVLLGKAASVGKVAIVDTDMEFNIWSPIALVRVGSQHDPRFVYYQLQSAELIRQIVLLTNSSSQGNIGMGDIERLVLSLPEKDEQTAIATILTDMDAELVELETRLAKAHQLKQGVMQELLTGRIRLVQPASTVVPLSKKRKETPVATARPHNRQINEAVVIAVLTKHFGSEDWPLARVRRTKLAYLLHRHAEGQAVGFLKKAAGPYDPRIRYKGPEGIALKKDYVQTRHNGKYEGFVASENIAEAEAYFEKWYGNDVMVWLEQFHMRKTEELELLTTVDMAVEDLRREGKSISVGAVKQLIHDHPEWKPKLDRPAFSDIGIAGALAECQTLFAT